MTSPQPILHFWFEELTPKQHFVKDAALDETIRARFGETLEAAARCELFAWRATTALAATPTATRFWGATPVRRSWLS